MNIRKNVIAIYHHPQECGEPYLAFVSQKSGKVIEYVTVPTGYFDSGMERVDIYTPVYSFIEKVHMFPKPTVDNVRLNCGCFPNPKKYVFRVTKVDNIQEDNQPPFTTWTADVYVEACTHNIKWKYDPDKDEFLKRMTQAGFDLSSYDINTRMRTPFIKFLTDVCSKYKDYHLINLIEIG